MVQRVSLLGGGAPAAGGNIFAQIFGIQVQGEKGAVPQSFEGLGWIATIVYVGHYGITALSIASVIFLVRSGGWKKLHFVMMVGLSGCGLGTALFSLGGSIDNSNQKLRGKLYYGLFHLSGGLLDLVSGAMLWAKANKGNGKLNLKTDTGLAILFATICGVTHIIIAYESLAGFWRSGGRITFIRGMLQNQIFVALRFVTSGASLCVCVLIGVSFCEKGAEGNCNVTKFPYVWLLIISAGNSAFMGLSSLVIQMDPNSIADLQFNFCFTAANIMAGVGYLYIAGPALKNNWPQTDKMRQAILSLSVVAGSGHCLYFLAPLYKPPIGGGGGYY